MENKPRLFAVLLKASLLIALFNFAFIFLKDIPFVGWLFKNWRVQKEFEELVVFITPRIAAAGSEHLPSAEQIWREQMKQTQGSQPAAVPAIP